MSVRLTLEFLDKQGDVAYMDTEEVADNHVSLRCLTNILTFLYQRLEHRYIINPKPKVSPEYIKVVK